MKRTYEHKNDEVPTTELVRNANRNVPCPHAARIKDLKASYPNGKVEPNIYFRKDKARFRLQIGGIWIGHFYTLEGARREKLAHKAELENNKLTFKKGFTEGDVRFNHITGLFELDVYGKTQKFLHLRRARKQSWKINRSSSNA